ncbi:MAG: MFS transporter, partial [Planctomycetes bacterium]|nr:MFS transporter [Planctomycetota bacterium]
MELKEEGCPGRQGDRRRLRLRRDLRVSLADGAAHGGMVGFGETYLPAFVLAVGLGEIMAGLIASVPLLAGGLMQLASPAGVRILGSHKRWVILCAGIQAVSFVPFLLAALGGRITGPTALLIAAIYWGTGLATGPAWNTWIGTVVPHAVRSRFFAFRTRASQAAVFGGFLAGGLGLQLAASAGHAIAAFAVMFALAGLCRFGSVVLLTLHSEPVPIPANMRRVSAREMWRLFQGDGGGKLLVYLVAVQAAVQLSSPFFTPFMFTKLHFSYGQYVFLLSVAYLTKILALPFFGRLARRFGAWRVLWIGGIGITPISAAWLVTQDFGWLAAVQVVSGVVWAAYELAFFLLFFESIRDEERTSVLTVYNFINSLAWVSGAVLGGALLVSTGAGFHGYL